MSFVSKVLDRRKVWKALRSYPIYSPPFRDAEAVLSKAEIAANYEYFLKQKGERIQYLAAYFSRFSIELRLKHETLPALDHWLRRYGGHLVPRTEPLGAFVDHEPTWSQDYLGLNVINDIAIFAGDYVLSKNPNARWDVYYGDGTKYDYEEPGFGLPCLFGLLNVEYLGRHHSIMHEVFECCLAGHWRLLHGGVGGTWDIPGEFVRHLDYLTDSNPPPHGRLRLVISGRIGSSL